MNLTGMLFCETIFAKASFSIAYAPRSAMSWAVEWWLSLSRPEGVENFVSFIPRSFAFSFIRFMNFSVSPETAIAAAFAASLPEQRSMPFAKESSVTMSPCINPIEVPSTLIISGVISISLLPCAAAYSSVKSEVIILVVLAIGMGSVSFLLQITAPESAQIKMADLAETSSA